MALTTHLRTFIFWDSRIIATILAYVSYYAFNSLFEIRRSRRLPPRHTAKLLSILFLRFRRCLEDVAGILLPRLLSILFLRFVSSTLAGSIKQAILFQFSFWDSRIVSVAPGACRFPYESFNSLFEIQSGDRAIHFFLKTRLPFQFSFWDSGGRYRRRRRSW